ncbi:peptidase family M28 [Xylaria bambusicola]|uniref:peptidase family M28 n=1 Tax=Xylaria bambusicola TaxID=326684 RepID=UPI0020077ED6|nr:peptidase family M28 [Xylaria bambusicola]KAI0505452.1 peptidase family M28 [Xylaria bambusicola]
MRFLTVLSALLPLIAVEAAHPKPKISSKKLQAEIKTKNLWSHLVALDKIAAANGGNRAFGLPGYAASVDYVWEKISKIKGAKAWKQDFPALFNYVQSIELKLNDESFYVYGLTYSPSTSAEGITAELVLGPEGTLGCNANGYADLDVSGKIVIVDRFQCPTGGTLAGRVRPAAASGAAAVIVYNNVETNVTAGTLSAPSADFVPAGFINQADGLSLKDRLQAGESIVAYFQQDQIVEDRVTQNLFLESDGGDPDNVIVLGAHLDSVQAGAGINDDGSGSALLLELSKAVLKYATKTKVRFAWWGAEENGLVGSKYYCSNLEVSEVNRILAYLNFDMVSKGYFGVGDTDGSSHGSIGPAGSEVIEQIYIDYYTSKGLEVTPAILTNGSDYASFWGILNKPFGFINTGTAPAQDPCYHQACDTINNPDKETITINARAAANAIAILSTDGPRIIPKTIVNATVANTLRTGVYGVDTIAFEDLSALGELHLGCGHEM